jgi:hypothetical protein
VFVTGNSSQPSLARQDHLKSLQLQMLKLIMQYCGLLAMYNNLFSIL